MRNDHLGKETNQERCRSGKKKPFKSAPMWGDPKVERGREKGRTIRLPSQRKKQ